MLTFQDTISSLRHELEECESLVSCQKVTDETTMKYGNVVTHLEQLQSTVESRKEELQSKREKLMKLSDIDQKLDHLLKNIPLAMPNASEVQQNVHQARLSKR